MANGLIGHTIASGFRPSRGFPETGAPEASCERTDPADTVLHLAELIPVVRSRLHLNDTVDDAVILQGLSAVSAQVSRRDRWRAAFGSELGRRLADQGCDLNTSLNVVVGLVPPPRS